MRIVYTASNRQGAGLQLKNFLSHCKHEIKIAAYSGASRYVDNFDWVLDTTYYDNNFDKLQYDIQLFEPHLIISDFEPIVAELGKWFNIPVVCASPVHILDAVRWHSVKRKRKFSREYLEHWKNANNMPKDLKWITSPFQGLEMKPGNYEWVEPYFNQLEQTNNLGYALAIINDDDRKKKLEQYFAAVDFEIKTCTSDSDDYLTLLAGCDFVISTGETSIISDALFNNKPLGLLLSSDPEAMWNNMTAYKLNLAFNLERLEFMQQLGVELLNESYEKRHSLNKYKRIDGLKKLHEKLEELCNIS